MNKALFFSRNILLSSVAGLAFALFSSSAHADGNVKTQGRLSLQYIDEDERDLTRGRDNSLSEEAVLSVEATPNEDITAFTELRALHVSGTSGFDDDTGRTLSREQSFLEAREFWVQKKNISGHVPLYVQAGRQRLREPRSFWWNSNQDMVRLGYNGTLSSGFVGLGENLASYRAGHENDFAQNEEGRLRFLGEAVWQYKYDHFLEGRFLLENDHSGIEAPGSIVDVNDRDNEDLDAFWAGVRSIGKFSPREGALASLRYRADVAGLFGDVDTLTSAGGPGLNQRTITGSTDGDLSAWAFDGSLTFDTELPLNPVFTTGYAYGSGDSNPGGGGTDHAFRQTGLDGGNSRLGLGRTFHKNYGEVLHPELSNLHILTAGADVPVTEHTDMGLTYFNYRLVRDNTSLRSAGISAPLNGTDKDIGQALDFVLNVDLDDELNFKTPHTDDTAFRFIIGSFFPGSAYAGPVKEEAFRVFTEVKFRF